ncbi:FkbM family methyltransferase [Giesbergeria anulus]|uniref:Methyltransferase, FkbM family n=1 Tax=Giesbergeria anulus TaxID=180197 RepID=A0A1H9L879_9BURK|nr:FkbM family methyltransferase [Giesbergeria anulus]SER07375.1 methyltransferase, FkbM family [Giesbergeria anulus]
MTNYWPVVIKNNVTVCVQKNLASLSTYVLLEQEDWFESEISFVRKFIQPEMNVFDIGANHGVYGLSIAKLLNKGKVWAFEPTSSPSNMLEKSIELNCFNNVVLVKAGLSDADKKVEISISANSELNSLHKISEKKEEVQLLSLDKFIQDNKIQEEISFVKLDAEGEEEFVIQGGHKFFNEQSPLVMFEIKNELELNFRLIDLFKDLGYQVYRLNPEINVLVEYCQENFDDGFLLNLFACKNDTRNSLISRNLLATPDAIQKEKVLIKNKNRERKNDELIDHDWIDFFKDFQYGQILIESWKKNIESKLVLDGYLLGVKYAVMGYKSDCAAKKIAFFESALYQIEDIAKYPSGANLFVWLSRIHLLNILGDRSRAIALAQDLGNYIYKKKPEDIGVDWPFFLPELEQMAYQPKGSVSAWLAYVVFEFFESNKSFSGYFSKESNSNLIDFLIKNPNITLNCERAILIKGILMKKNIVVNVDHRIFTDSINQKLWSNILGKS